jgi:fluoride exporter
MGSAATGFGGLGGLGIQALAIGLGAVLGAWGRWGLGLGLNAVWPQMALGTLMANWLGSLVMGGLLALIQTMPDLPQVFRLFLVTGLLGSLTTFSALTGEVLEMLQAGRFADAAIASATHLIGGLILAVAGFYLVDLLRK